MTDSHAELLKRIADFAPEYYIDVVFVIDATRSMAAYLDTIKKNVLSFDETLREDMTAHCRKPGRFRAKVIWFRDFYFDGMEAYGESEFCELPGQRQKFQNYVEQIEAEGGGDEPETALEALTLAMRSDFTTEGDRKRHIVILFTDADAHKFEDYERIAKEASSFGQKPQMYPADMPADLSEFVKAWEENEFNLDPHGKRMVLITPEKYPWNFMWECLENVLWMDIRNLSETDSLDSDVMLFSHLPL